MWGFLQKKVRYYSGILLFKINNPLQKLNEYIELLMNLIYNGWIDGWIDEETDRQIDKLF